MINADYMQICHRHKYTAVRSLTFLFVTSKRRSEDTGPALSPFTCFPHQYTSRKGVCVCLDGGKAGSLVGTAV